MGRIIYNTTFHVHNSVVEQWRRFMQERYRVNVERSTLSFTGYRMCRVLLGQETEEVTFAVQFSSPTREAVELWLKGEGHLLLLYLRKHFGERVLMFSTFMEECDE